MRSAALALVFLSIPVAAQTVVPLDEALSIVETQSADVLRAEAAIFSSTAAVDAVDDSRWPALSLSAGGGQRYGLSFDQTSGALTQSTVESMSLGVSARYTVFDGFERRAERRAAEAGLREAELLRARATQGGRVGVLSGYLAVAQAQAALEVAEETVRSEEDLLREIDIRVEFGDRPASDAAQQHERIATARSAVVAAERDHALAHARLVRLLGLDPARTYTFPSPTTDDTAPLASVDALVADAIASRSDLQAAEIAIQAAEANGRAARASRLPQVALSGSIGTSYSSATTGAVPGQFGDNRTGSIGLSVSMPLLDRGITRQRVRQAEARASALRAEAADVQRAIALEVQERHIRLDAIDAQVVLAAERVTAAEAALAAERARYENGDTTIQSVSLLQSRVADARTAQALLRVQATFERRMLLLTVGE
ncbi:MAG: TolC family protein [Bacteroidota bacterium]